MSPWSHTRNEEAGCTDVAANLLRPNELVARAFAVGTEEGCSQDSPHAAGWKAWRRSALRSAASKIGVRPRRAAWPYVVAATIIAVSAAHAEVKLNVESYVGVPDPDLGGAIVITNAGDEIEINSITLNRTECRFNLYEPSGNGAQAELAKSPYRLVTAFSESQRQLAESSAHTLGRTANETVVHLKTGDRVAIMAPSVLPALRSAGFIDAGSCGSALINMTVHSGSGDLYFEW